MMHCSPILSDPVCYVLCDSTAESLQELFCTVHPHPYSPHLLSPLLSLNSLILYSRKREVQLAVNLVSKLSSYTPTDIAAFTEKTRAECAELSGTAAICICTLTYSFAKHLQLPSLPSIHLSLPSMHLFYYIQLTVPSTPSSLPTFPPSFYHISHLTLPFTISLTSCLPPYVHSVCPYVQCVCPYVQSHLSEAHCCRL